MRGDDLVFTIFYQHGMSIEQVAKLTGLGRTTVYRIKKTGRMSKESLIKLLLIQQDLLNDQVS